MVIPSNLKKGDKVGLIAPSGPPSQDNINSATSIIKNMGLIPILGKYAKENIGYLAGSDDARAWDINDMFANNSIKGIICLRGGYGCIRILDKIDWNIVKENPKFFIGYSDITALHICINQICCFITYHGPMPTEEVILNELSKETTESFKNSIFNNNLQNKNSNNFNLKILISGNFSGQLVGGNLAVITSLLGTKYEINTDNKVLFLEDIGEPPYKVDGMLTQLKLCGKLKNLKGVILGSFVDEKKQDIPVNNIFKDTLQPLGIPCLYDFPSGHSVPNITFALGSIYTNELHINIS